MIKETIILGTLLVIVQLQNIVVASIEDAIVDKKSVNVENITVLELHRRLFKFQNVLTRRLQNFEDLVLTIAGSEEDEQYNNRRLDTKIASRAQRMDSIPKRQRRSSPQQIGPDQHQRDPTKAQPSNIVEQVPNAVGWLPITTTRATVLIQTQSTVQPAVTTVKYGLQGQGQPAVPATRPNPSVDQEQVIWPAEHPSLGKHHHEDGDSDSQRYPDYVHSEQRSPKYDFQERNCSSDKDCGSHDYFHCQYHEATKSSSCQCLKGMERGQIKVGVHAGRTWCLVTDTFPCTDSGETKDEDCLSGKCADNNKCEPVGSSSTVGRAFRLINFVTAILWLISAIE